MRESFGGAFMIKLVLIFIVIYVSFMAVAINYAKAFRVKNEVINIIEQIQYTGTDADNNMIDTYLSGFGYAYGGRDNLKKHCITENSGLFTENGVCIIKKGDANYPYYRVITYIDIALPFLKISMTIPISGETKVIKY